MQFADVSNDVLIPAVVLLAALFGLMHLTFGGRFFRTSGRRRYYRPHRDNEYRVERGANSQHFGQQLQAVMAAPFEKCRIMNSFEYRAFRIIEADVLAARKGYRVFAQTSLGEVLRSPSEEAFFSINSKRVDVLVVNQAGWPVLAVEYQGEGHFQGTAAARDAIKKEALRKAGVRYLEVVPADTDAQIRSRVREYLDWDTPSVQVATGYDLQPAPH